LLYCSHLCQLVHILLFDTIGSRRFAALVDRQHNH
jgi:hypothetical protein